MVKRINKRVHIEKNQLLLYQGGVMTMLIMGTGVVYSPSLVLLDTQILYLPGVHQGGKQRFAVGNCVISLNFKFVFLCLIWYI